MYTTCALFSRLFLEIYLFVLSLYAIGWLVTLPCEISVKSPSDAPTVILEPEGKVCSMYNCTYIKWIGWRVSEMCHLIFFQNGRRPPSWIWSNRKWHRSIRGPRKPHPRTNIEGIGWCIAELWPFEIFQSVWMGPQVGRLLVSHQSVVNIHTSYTDLSKKETKC